MNGSGLQDVEHFSGSARAQLDAATLHVQSSYAPDNRLANGDADFATNPGGVPTGFQADAEAHVSDTFGVTSTALVDHLQFTYRLTGNVISAGGLDVLALRLRRAG